MKKEIHPSSVFNNDEKYLRHLRNSIAILEGCIYRNEDVMIEGPMATRVLLDFYYETLRRTINYGRNKQEEKEEDGK